MLASEFAGGDPFCFRLNIYMQPFNEETWLQANTDHAICLTFLAARVAASSLRAPVQTCVVLVYESLCRTDNF